MTNLPDLTARAPALTGPTPALVDALDQALVTLDGRLPELAGNPEAQAVIHHRLADLRRNIAVVTDRLERMLYDELPERVNRNGRTVKDRLVLDGIGVVEPTERGGGWKDIEYERLIQTVIREAWDAGDIGHPQDAAAIVAEVVTMSGIRSDARKGTGLAKYGHDRSEFATRTEGTPTVRIIPNEAS